MSKCLIVLVYQSVVPICGCMFLLYPATATAFAAPLSKLKRCWLCVLWYITSFSCLEKVIFAYLYHSQTFYTNLTRYRDWDNVDSISKFPYGRILWLFVIFLNAARTSISFSWHFFFTPQVFFILFLSYEITCTCSLH